MKQVLDAIEYLLKFPGMGRIGRVPNTRELVISSSPFIAVYQIRRQDIFILRILHTARKWPA
jgi:toxin ParE1/3/4